MFGLGFSEILFLGVLALIVIGPKQLPEVARTLGRFLNELKRSTDILKDDIKSQVDLDLDLRRNLLQEELKAQQEKLRQKEASQGLPLPEEDRIQHPHLGGRGNQMPPESKDNKKNKPEGST